MGNYSNGSLWRRWDLHVHTPETNKNDQYEGKTPEEKWDKFYAEINKYVGDGGNPVRNIAVIGVTDYLSVENYYKVKKDNRLPASIKMVLPNVELRITPVSKKEPINIHCIFPPDLNPDYLNENFFNKLTFEYQEVPYSATRNGLISLGKAYKGNDTLDDDEAYIEGVNQFVVSIDKLKKVFKDNPALKEQTVIVVSNSSNDGVSGLHAHKNYFEGPNCQLDATRQQIYQFSDLIFSANESDRKYFLGESKDSREEVIHKCGSLMGCIHGSDAHKLSDLFEPKDSKYCWIKANPTFEGLKQILYEPESRIKISSVQPEEKSDYQIISSIAVDNGNFQKEAIQLNENLTCIIGGKSTGKSLLLHNIANAIDETQVKEKEATTGSLKENQPDRRKLTGVQVYWKDGSLNDGDGMHKIVYIPQAYLNRISDNGEEISEIDQIIKSVLLQDHQFKDSYDIMSIALNQKSQEIDHLIMQANVSFEKMKELREEQKSIGTKDGLNKRINELNNKKSNEVKESAITDVMLKKYENALHKSTEYAAQIKQLKDEINSISKTDSLFDIKLLINDFSGDLLQRVSDIAERIKINADKEWNIERDKIKEELDNQIKEVSLKNASEQDVIKEIRPKIEKNEAMKVITNELQRETGKLEQFNKLEKQWNDEQARFDTIVNQLIDGFLSYKEIHDKHASDINNSDTINTNGLKFNVKTVLRKDSLIDKIEEFSNKRSLKNHQDIINPDLFSEECLTADNVEKFIKAYFEGKIKIIKNKKPMDILREVLIDWFITTYRVKMDNDFIDVMSPGKKALALLKILIDLDENTCPILIDQPEDDLDNRSIFNELIPFLRKKKVQRQIIVVTHNANVVLGGDAEEIIVANQDGQNAKNKEYRFEYKSGAIEDMEKDREAKDILSKKTIQEHICEILEGGKEAFELRRKKYHM